MTTKKETLMEQLIEYSKEWKLTLAETAKEFVFMFYAAAGFREEQLIKELDGKTEDEIFEMYFAI